MSKNILSEVVATDKWTEIFFPQLLHPAGLIRSIGLFASD